MPEELTALDQMLISMIADMGCPKCPEDIPEVIDVCGHAGFKINLLPSSIDPVSIVVHCGEYLEGIVLKKGMFVDAYHTRDDLSSVVVHLNSHPDLVPVPEPQFGASLAYALITMVVLAKVKSYSKAK